MKIATLAIIIREGKVLLGRKQGAPEIGEGTLNGPGGKQEEGETLEQCLIRETEEELGIALDASKSEKVAVITFFAGGNADFEVHVYRTEDFTGKPRETSSMVPEWHDTSRIPYDRMLESDRRWLSRVIYGEKFCANVYYRERAKGFISIEFLPFVL
jgi:8-oxo-dGTP pyrophosphatase MutT (NUDIX family)